MTLNIEVSKEDYDKVIIRLINQLWKLIPMKENGEDWVKQLDTVILEIAGLSDIFTSIPQFLQLLSKLQGLKKLSNEDISFNLYRKTIFESITILKGSCRS